MSILIEDVTAGKPAAPVQVEEKFDLQDGLVLGGIGFAEAAALVIWWPASLILAAVFCLGFALMIELSKKSERTKKR